MEELVPQSEDTPAPTSAPAPKPETKTKPKLKLYLALFLFIALLVGGGYGYFTYTKYMSLLGQAKVALEENKSYKATAIRYDQIVSVISAEKQVCEDLITTGEGNFSNFAYCEGFLEWFEKKNLQNYFK